MGWPARRVALGVAWKAGMSLRRFAALPHEMTVILANTAAIE
jgi:hypothetical protein